MTDLQKQFEATGYASWINSELYPDGRIYTQEYTQWLEMQLASKQGTPQNEAIISAIAAYLEKETSHDYISEHENVQFGGSINIAHFTHAGFCHEIAAEILTAIAPYLEAGAGWDDAPDWAEWMISYSDGSHNFSKGYPSVITTGVIKVECRP